MLRRPSRGQPSAECDGQAPQLPPEPGPGTLNKNHGLSSMPLPLCSPGPTLLCAAVMAPPHGDSLGVRTADGLRGHPRTRRCRWRPRRTGRHRAGAYGASSTNDSCALPVGLKLSSRTDCAGRPRVLAAEPISSRAAYRVVPQRQGADCCPEIQTKTPSPLPRGSRHILRRRASLDDGSRRFRLCNRQRALGASVSMASGRFRLLNRIMLIMFDAGTE
jgi:hypothetical protein